MSQPTFSLCHSTARLPDGWRNAYQSWKDNCDDWSQVEYILGVDAADRERYPQYSVSADDDPVGIADGSGIILAENRGRQCAVDGWNAAGRRATGKIMITAADDMFPPPHWDTELLKIIPDLDGQYAIEVKSGTGPADDEWMRVMLHSIITRPYYERIGNFFCPQYVGMMADADFTDMARFHGVVIDARHLTFKHWHWIGTHVPFDEIYQRQNAQQNYDLGNQIIGGRRASGFAGENH